MSTLMYKRTTPSKARNTASEQLVGSASHTRQARRRQSNNPLLIAVVVVILLMLSSMRQEQAYTAGEYGKRATDPLHLDILQDIQLGHLLGKGDDSTVFRAHVPKLGSEEYACKIGHELFWIAKEINAFDILNKEPTIPNIPKLYWRRQESLNPFARVLDHAEAVDHFRTHGVKKKKIDELLEEEELGILIVELVPHTGIPDKSNLEELARFCKSLLETLEFAHSRNIINNDIVRENVLYDNMTGTAYLPDWNDMREFIPHQVGLNPFVEMVKVLPEAQGVDMPVHATVSAFDIYCSGLLLNEILCGNRRKCRAPKSSNAKRKQAHDLVSQMLTKDPYRRPSAGELLMHEFFASEWTRSTS